MEKKLIPLQDRVVVEAIVEEERSPGGILIPDTAKEKPMKGKVIYVGAGAVSSNGIVIPVTVKPGNTVFFAKWSGTEITLDGKKLLIMKESDLLAVLVE